MYSEILSAIKAVALTYASPFTAIVNGTMPEENGLAIFIASGAETKAFFKGGTYEISIVLNGKHSNLQTLINTLSTIHINLSGMNFINTTSFYGDLWQIIKISTSSAPTYIDKEVSSNQWIYGSSLRIEFYYKGA